MLPVAVTLWTALILTHSGAAAVNDYVTGTATTQPTTLDAVTNHTTYHACHNVISNSSIAKTADTKCNDNSHSHIKDTKGFREMSSFCPGAVEYLSSQSEPAIFRVSVPNCKRPGYDPRSQHGVVYGVCDDATAFCQFLVKVPRGMIVRARVRSFFPVCRDYWATELANRWSPNKYARKGFVSLRCSSAVHKDYLSTTEQMYVRHINRPMLQMLFEHVPFPFKLNIVRTSNISGYVTPLAPEAYSLQRRDITATLTVPGGHVAMVSFGIFKMHYGCFRRVFFRWNEQHKIPVDREESVSIDYERLVRTYLTTQVKVQVNLNNNIPQDFNISCMKMLFSFQPENRVPQRLSSGLYNCSVDDYWRFQQHLDCNLKVECEDGRDEGGHCPFSSPACDGWVAVQHKCYKKLTFAKPTHPRYAMDECLRHGWRVASIKTNHELTHFAKIFQGRSHVPTFIGLFWKKKDTSFMYRYFYIWDDNSLLYSTNFIRLRLDLKIQSGYNNYLKCDCPVCKCQEYRMSLQTVSRLVQHVMCEKYVQNEELFHNQSLQFSAVRKLPAAIALMKQALAVCPEGHVTHSFLACDQQSGCGGTVCTFSKRTTVLSEVIFTAQIPAPKMAVFTCSNDGVTVPYSLVCDFRQDCRDKSDESFCKHPVCGEFACTNGQCLSSNKKCNDHPDCLDDSDEIGCAVDFARDTQIPKPQQKWLINLDGRGYFRQHLMEAREPCPETHYGCTAEWISCLPVYTRCNGYYDCVFHEDERGCKTIVCPGLYRCRGSTVCLHIDHLCDGWPQCPQRDDEWLCNMTCPEGCLCQGHGLLCTRPFSTHIFPQLRYLDAHGSGMAPSDLRNMTNYITYLNLAECSISVLPAMSFPNLQHMDLSDNRLTSVDMDVFLKLENLKVLSLQGNPLRSVVSEISHPQHHALKRLDVSRTRLSMLDGQIVKYFPELQYINVSLSHLRFIRVDIFQNIPHLRQLDIRGNMINTFPLNIFVESKNLRFVRSTDYRLCCKDVLPDISPATKCSAPRHFLSSCERLVRSEVYVLSLWCVASFATLGNMACAGVYCIGKSIVHRGRIIIFMVSLQCSNFCMGIYAAVIAQAHEKYRGQYIHHEGRWKESVSCKVAGFLCLLSSEVSVLIIVLLSVDHLIVLRFPLSKCRLNKKSAALACGVAWFVGILLASIPLLPALSHCGHYGQTAVCSLMLYDRDHVQRGFCFIHIIFVLNCFMCLVVSAAQFIMYRALPKYRVLVESNKYPAHVSVDLVLRIAVTDVLGWVSVAMTSFLALADEAGSQETNVFMAVMVLPLNSAVNPLLCLWHTVSYKRRLQQEERLLHVLKAKMRPTKQ